MSDRLPDWTQEVVRRAAQEYVAYNDRHALEKDCNSLGVSLDLLVRLCDNDQHLALAVAWVAYLDRALEFP